MVSKHPHRNLEAWKQSMELVVEVYALTRGFPREEIYGLCSQMRRAAVSIPSNIAEGSADMTSKQFINFLTVAMGSLSELNTQIEIALKLGYIEKEPYNLINSRIDKCKALVYGLKRSIINKNSK
jgi:four helix bundle protein